MTGTQHIGKATRHFCSLRCSHQCDSGNGAPKRAKCRHCKAVLTTQTGTWGVFEWTGTGRYPLDAAISLHKTEAAAEKARTGELVVRWI